MNHPYELIQRLFLQARDVPKEEQKAWLAEHCPNNSLREEVLELLLHDQPDDFLEQPLMRPPSRLLDETFDRSTDSLPNSKPASDWLVGRYKLLQKIGEGGFGVVFMAEQTNPVRRRVAIKMLRTHADAKNFVARFESERQALAMMEHPHIAKIFDGGVDDQGKPYLVMELVHGTSITEFCQQHALSTRDRILLLTKVCLAVQHAHQKGIIHRDLKPTNILVSLLDGVPVPKVIDFGIAKALNGPLTDKTLFTSFHQMIGTLEYMSPEQAETSILDADTRSDVFSLGVIGYELLTGTTPFDGKSLRSLPFVEIQRTIREVDPPKPSDRLSKLSLQARSIDSPSPNRVPAPGKTIQGDLDWIVMKAMEKDRERRYGAAQSLADDLQRWLADEPIEARPPSLAYRLSKLARKHRRSLSLGLALAVGIVLSAAGIGYGISERDAARQRLADQAIRNSQLQQIVDLEKERVASLAYGNAMLAANESWVNGRRTTTLDLLNECPESKRGIEWHWQKFWADDHSKILVPSLPGQGDGQLVQSILYSPDNQWIISGSEDGMVRVWDVAQGQERRSWRIDPARSIVAMSMDSKCQRLLCGCQDGSASLWDFESGKLIDTAKLDVAISSVALPHADVPGIAVGNAEGTIYFWKSDFKEHPLQLVSTRQPLQGPVRSLGFNATGDKILAAGKGGVTLFECDQGSEINTLGESWITYGALFTKDRDHLAIFGPPIHLLNLAKGLSSSQTTDIPSTEILSATYVPDEDALIIATTDQCLRRISLGDGRQETLAYSHVTPLSQIAAASNGRSLAVLGQDGSIRLWDRSQLTAPERTIPFSGSVAQIGATDSRHVYALSNHGELVHWDAHRQEILFRMPRHQNQGFGLAVHPARSLLATNGVDRQLLVSSIPSLELIASHELSLVARHLIFHPDGKHLVAPAPAQPANPPSHADEGTSQRLALWNLESGQVDRLYSGLTNWAMRVQFSTDGSLLAAATVSDGALVWRTTETMPIRFLMEDFPQVEDVAFSNDNKFLFAAYRNGQVCIWELPSDDDPFQMSSQPHAKMVCHGDRISSLLVTSDGSRLITASIGDSKLRVWDWRREQKVAEFESGLPGITDIKFVGDQEAIVLGGTNGQILWWQLKNESSPR